MNPLLNERRDKRLSRIEHLVSRSYLPIGRLYYAGVSGLALVLSAAVARDLTVVGEYIYQVGFASAVATVMGLGLDRIMARRMAVGSLAIGLPVSVMKFRVLLAGAIIACAFIVGSIFNLVLVLLVCALFVVSRVFYADLEAIWIGSRQGDRAIFIALLMNGSITAGGLVGGSLVNSATMIALSSAGNLAAGLFLLSRGRLQLRQGQLPGIVSEANGISWSLVLGVIYARVDLVILASLGSPLESVAFYGIITRIFDALVLIRGSMAQDEARSIASLRLRTRARRLLALSMRVQLVLLLLSIAGLAATWLFSTNDIDFGMIDSFATMGVLFSSLPLFFSHFPTSAMIYADRRTYRLLIGSAITCAGSVGIKWYFIQYYSVTGAVLAIGVVEWLSALVFFFLYWANARNLRSFRIILVPLASGVGLTAGVLTFF